jgi:hypothetical protein
LLAQLPNSSMVRVVKIAILTVRLAPDWLASVLNVLVTSYFRLMEVVVVIQATFTTVQVRHAYWKQSAQQASIWTTQVTRVFHAV